MVDSLDTAFQLYQTGEDAAGADRYNVKIIYEDENNEYHDQMVDRPDKYSADEVQL